MCWWVFGFGAVGFLGCGWVVGCVQFYLSCVWCRWFSGLWRGVGGGSVLPGQWPVQMGFWVVGEVRGGVSVTWAVGGAGGFLGSG